MLSFIKLPKFYWVWVILLLATTPLFAQSYNSQNYTRSAHLERTAASSLSSPFGVAVDAQGNMAIADSYNHQVLVGYRNAVGEFTQTVTLPLGTSGVPYGVAFGAGGTLYIADLEQKRVLKEVPTGSGAYTETVVADSSPAYGLNFPNAVAVDQNNNVYIADTDNNRVLKEVPLNGGYRQSVVADSSSAYNLNAPKGVAVDNSGNVYIADTLNHRVVMETPRATGFYQQTKVADTGSAPAGFDSFGYDFPFGLAIDSSGYVYYSTYDTTTGRSGVSKALASGNYTNFTFTISKVWSGSTVPFGLAVDSFGHLYIAEANRGLVVVFGTDDLDTGTLAIGASQTTTLTFHFTASATPGRLLVLTAGAFGGDFSDAGGGTCKASTSYSFGDSCTVNVKFTPQAPGQRDGAVILDNPGDGTQYAVAALHGTGTGPQIQYAPSTQSAVGTGFAQPTGLAVDGYGDVYVADYSNHRVIQQIPSGTGYRDGAVLTGYQTPEGVAVDGAGQIYIADSAANTVYRAYPTGSGGYARLIVDDSLNRPHDVVVDVAGNLYVATSVGLIKETLQLDGSYAATTISAGTHLHIAIDAAGNLYAAINSEPASRLVKFARASNGYTESIIHYPGTSTSTLQGIVVDAAGAIFVVEDTTGQVTKLSPTASGTYTESTFATGFSFPYSLARDAAGDLFVSDFRLNKVVKYDVATTPTSLTFADTRAGSTSTDSPKSLNIYNGGNAPLNFTVPASGTNPVLRNANSAPFALDTASTCPQLTATSSAASLAAGATCTYAIDFAPTQTGTFTGSLQITDNNLNQASQVQTIGLSGVATKAMPTATVANVSVYFGATGTLTAQFGYTLASAPTGAITYSLESGTLALSSSSCVAQGSIRNCKANFDSSQLNIGQYNVTISEAADASYIATQATATLQVNPPVVSIAVTPLTVPFGKQTTTTLTATVTYTGSPGGTPVFVIDGGSPVGATQCTGSASPRTCTADVSTTGLAVGRHTVTASESDEHAHSAASGQAILTVVRPSSTATLAISDGTSPISSLTAGGSATLTATITIESTRQATGQVRFYEAVGGTCTAQSLLGTSSLTASGTATLRIRPGLGDHQYKAVFLGNAAGGPVKSACVPLSINSGPTTVALTPSGSTGNYTLSATVTGSGPAAPTGSVSLLDTSNKDQELGNTVLVPGTVTQSFASAVNYPAGTAPVAVTTGDFNGDAIPDLAVAGRTGIAVLLGISGGGFNTAVRYTAGSAPLIGIAAYDLNGDGVQDLVATATAAGQYYVLLGNSSGTFRPAVTYNTNGAPSGIAIGDFNADGVPDLALANFNDVQSSGTISVSLGRGNGTFGSPVSYSVGSRPRGIAADDLNGDSFPDLVVANENDSSVSVLLGKGDGTFASQVRYPTGSLPFSLTLGDVNRDGFTDIAVANGGDNTVSILRGSGDGTFGTQVTYASGGEFPFSVAAGDLNSDGLLDLAVVNSNSNTVTVLAGQADGTFAPAVPNRTGLTPFSVAIADFNGDGVNDVAAAASDSDAASVLLNGLRAVSTASITRVSPIGPAGTQHTVEASYKADGRYAANFSPQVSVDAAPQMTMLTIGTSTATAAYGTAITLTANLSPSLVQGRSTDHQTVTFRAGQTIIGTAELSAGVATYTTMATPPGTYAIVAAYDSDTYFAGSASSPLSVEVTKGKPTVVASGPGALVYGTVPAKLSAIVAYTGDKPTGALTFSVDGGAPIPSNCLAGASVLDCSADYNGLLSPTTHSLTASLGEDKSWQATTSNSASFTVSKATPVLQVSLSPSTTTYGNQQPRVSVSVTFAGPQAPRSPVTLSVDGTVVTQSVPCTGVASPLSCSIDLPGNLPTPGTYKLVAAVTSDTNFNGASSDAGTLTVVRATPGVVAAFIPAVITYGSTQPTLTATVSYTGPQAPSGAVTFSVDGTQLTAAVPCTGAASTLSCSIVLPGPALRAGSHTLVANLAADSNYSGATTSPAATLAISQARPTITLSSPATINYGTASIPLSASVAYAGGQPPTGGVTLYFDGTPVATVPCTGTAPPLVCATTYSTASLAVGTHTVLASIAPDGNYMEASSTLNSLVNSYVAPTCRNFSVSALPSSLTVVAAVDCQDPQGLPLTTTLDWGDNTTNTAQQGSNPHTYRTPNAYPVVLTATNSAGLSYRVQQSVTTTQLPTCTLSVITSDNTTTAVLTASTVASCTNFKGQPLPGEINWGDSSTPTPTPANGTYRHNYGNPLTPTTYTVTLSASDGPALTAFAVQRILVVPQLTIAQGGRSANVSTSTAPQLPTVAATQVTFVCSSVDYVVGGQTVTHALPSAYHITCTSPIVPTSSLSSTPISVTINTAAGTSTLVQNRSRGYSILACVLLLPLPLLALGTATLGAGRSRTFGFLALLLLCFALSSCGGSFESPAAIATPDGLYFITVTEKVVSESTPPAFVQTSLIVPLQVGK